MQHVVHWMVVVWALVPCSLALALPCSLLFARSVYSGHGEPNCFNPLPNNRSFQLYANSPLTTVSTNDDWTVFSNRREAHRVSRSTSFEANGSYLSNTIHISIPTIFLFCHNFVIVTPKKKATKKSSSTSSLSPRLSKNNNQSIGLSCSILFHL